MHAANAALAEALPRARAPPALGLPATVRLLYGEHKVLVEMPALAGAQARAATEGELAEVGGGGAGSAGARHCLAGARGRDLH
jgi:hypothetical protein